MKLIIKDLKNPLDDEPAIRAEDALRRAEQSKVLVVGEGEPELMPVEHPDAYSISARISLNSASVYDPSASIASWSKTMK